MKKKCDRCGKTVYWELSSRGNWYLVNEWGSPHFLKCQNAEDVVRLPDVTELRARKLQAELDQSFEQAIAK